MNSPYFSRYQLAERESIIDMIFNDVNFALDEFEIKDLKTLQLLADKKGDYQQGLAYLEQSLAILQRLRSPNAATVQRIIARIRG
jgi:hypothetical protein